MNLKTSATTPQPVSAGLNSGLFHLSPDQIDDHLIGAPAPTAAEHLAECDLCVSRVAEAAAPIEAFKVVTLAWSERRSATLPLHQTLARSASFHPRVAWAAAVVAALAIGVAIPVVSHQQHQQTAQTAAQTAAQTGAQITSRTAAPAAAQTDVQANPVAANNVSASASTSNSTDQSVRDTQMLRAIDRELDASAESPEALGLKSVSGAAARKLLPPSSVQD